MLNFLKRLYYKVLPIIKGEIAQEIARIEQNGVWLYRMYYAPANDIGSELGNEINRETWLIVCNDDRGIESMRFFDTEKEAFEAWNKLKPKE